MALPYKITDPQKDKLIDLRNKNINEAGWNEALWIQNTRDYLSGLKTKSWVDLLTTLQNRQKIENRGNLPQTTQWVKGYTTWQQVIPKVNTRDIIKPTINPIKPLTNEIKQPFEKTLPDILPQTGTGWITNTTWTTPQIEPPKLWTVWTQQINNVWANQTFNWIPVNQTTANEIKNNATEWQEALTAQNKSYTLAQWQYEWKKDNYTNFDEINNTANSVIGDITNARNQTWSNTLTPEQINSIATKYWITPEDVTNPLNIYKKLELSEKWKQDTWANTYAKWIENLTNQFERNTQDLQTNLDNTMTTVNQQLDDLQRQASENESVAIAQWVWSGAIWSSWFNQGIQNMRDNSNTVIQRLQESAWKIKTANDTDLQRLTQDYNTAFTEAKSDLDKQKQNLNMSAWLELNWLTETYWMWSDELWKKLDDIAEKYNLQSNALLSSYLNNINQINTITMDSIKTKEEYNNYADSIANKRYNDYAANNGKLLAWTSLTSLENDYEQWKLSFDKYSDLVNTMRTSITDALGKLWVVEQSDIDTVNHLLDAWKTPTEVMAQMQTLDKFKQKIMPDKTIDLWTKTRIYFTDWSYQEFDKEKLPFNVPEWNTVYDPTSWTFKSPTTWTWTNLTDKINSIKTDSNVWKWTNNPWNIMGDTEGQKQQALGMWAVWFYNSKNWRTYAVFPTWETGTQAMTSDIETKLSWWSTWATPQTSLANFAKWWTNWPNGAPNPWATNNMLDYLKKQWANVNANTKIWDIWAGLLAWAVQYNEWTLWQTGQNWTNVSNETSATAEPTKSELNKFIYSEKLTPNEQNAYLKEQKLLDKYLEWNSKKTTEWWWLLDWISSIQDVTFPEKTTEFKSKSYNYWTRMDSANAQIKNMEDKYKNSWTSTEYLAPRWEWMPNFLKTSDRQQYEQAQRNFVNSVLRQESWAVISDSEFSNAAKQYFPASWDTDATLDQKRANREQAIYNMLKSAWKDEQWRDIWGIWKELQTGGLEGVQTENTGTYKWFNMPK